MKATALLMEAAERKGDIEAATDAVETRGLHAVFVDARSGAARLAPERKSVPDVKSGICFVVVDGWREWRSRRDWRLGAANSVESVRADA
jgi:hypothetical protein